MPHRAITNCSRAASLCLFACLVGCSSPKGKDVGTSGGTTDGKDAATSSQTDAGKDEPAKLANGYETRISCGDLGKACTVQTGCNGTSTCQGGTCLPDVNRKDVTSCADGCPVDAPVCLFSTCISIDQLVCICSQEKPKNELSLCAGLRDGSASNPLGEGALCASATDACEAGLSCLTGNDRNGEPTAGICKESCEKDTDCDSYCCTVEPGIAGRHCAPRGLCLNPCSKVNGACDGQRNVCCEGLVCAGYAADANGTNPALVGCKLPCKANDECDSKCCVLFNQRDDGICAPIEFCP